MPFKNIKTQGDTSSWRSLHALVMFGKETARFDIKPSGNEDTDDKNQEFIGQSIKTDKGDLPENFQGMKPGTVVEDVYVLMDTKTKKVIAINPWEGTFDILCYELGSSAGRDDAGMPLFDFQPAEENKWGKDVKKFYASYEILEDTEFQGIFKGCRPRYHLQHLFMDDGHGMAAIEGQAYWKGKRTNAGKLLEWTTVHEIDEDMPFPPDGNCLPELERRLLALNKPVRGRFDKGWIVDVSKSRGSAVRVVPEEEVEKPGESDPVFGKG